MSLIRILVNPATKDVTVWPTCAHVGAGQTVTWELVLDKGNWKTDTLAKTGGSFLIVFPDGAPVSTVELRGAAKPNGKEFRSPAVSTVIRANVVGIFHYRVAICVGGVVYADMGCPSIKTQ